MAGEVNFYGIYIPLILIQALLAYMLYSGLIWLLEKWQLSRWLALPTISNLCLYIIVLGLVVWVGHLF